jgi:hypothetical protein
VHLAIKFDHDDGLAVFLKFPRALVFDVVHVADVFHGLPVCCLSGGVQHIPAVFGSGRDGLWPCLPFK